MDTKTPVTRKVDGAETLGNIGAHPGRDAEVGEIVDVEPWEAEWCLEVIEALYEHYFLMPARNAERLERLKKKID